MLQHERIALGTAVFGGLCIIVACWMSVSTALRVGYRRGATAVYRELRMFRDTSYDEYVTKVPGLTEAVYIARYHMKHYNIEPTGRARRPRPEKMTGNSAAPVPLTNVRRGMHRR